MRDNAAAILRAVRGPAPPSRGHRVCSTDAIPRIPPRREFESYRELGQSPACAATGHPVSGVNVVLSRALRESTYPLVKKAYLSGHGRVVR